MNDVSTGGNRSNTWQGLGARFQQSVEAEVATVSALRESEAHQTPLTETSAQYVWYVILLLSVVNIFNYMDRMALAVLAPLIKIDLQLSDAHLGLLTGFAFAFFYALCGIPIARWADRGIRRDIIVFALTVWSVMTALSGAAQNFWHLLLARVGLGAGEAGCLPPAQSIICDYVPLERRSGVYAVHTFGLYAGMMLGMVLAGWLGEIIGWRWTFALLGLPGIALALLVRLTLREPTRGRFDAIETIQTKTSFGGIIEILWRCRTYRMLAIFLTLNGFVQFGFNQWWPSFYARIFRLSLSSAGINLGFAIGAGSGIGILVGGLLANRIAMKDIRLPLMVGAAATCMAMPAVLGSILVSSASLSLFLVFLTTLFWAISNGPVVAAVYSVSRPDMRATAGTITIFFTSVLGFGLGPFCVGLLSDILAPPFGVKSLRYALLVPACLLPLVALALYRASRHLPNDLKAVGVQI